MKNCTDDRPLPGLFRTTIMFLAYAGLYLGDQGTIELSQRDRMASSFLELSETVEHKRSIRYGSAWSTSKS